MVPHVEPHWFHLVLHRIRYKLGKWFHILEPISIFWGKWFHIHKWNHYGSTWFPIVLCMFGDNGSTFFSKFGKWFHIGRSTVVPQHLSNFLVESTDKKVIRDSRLVSRVSYSCPFLKIILLTSNFEFPVYYTMG